MVTQVLMVVLLVAVVAVEVAAVTLVVRSPLRRKWGWVFVALLGITQLEFFWPAGPSRFNALALLLLGVGVYRHDGGPWTVALSFPLGAIIAMRRARRATREAAEAAETVEAPEAEAPEAETLR